MQAACSAARAPAHLATLAKSRQRSALVSTAQRAAADDAVTVCTPRISPSQPLPSAEDFTEIEVGAFERVFISDAGDAALISLCILMVSTATAALLSRVVRAHRGRERTLHSLAREQRYEAAFSWSAHTGSGNCNKRKGVAPPQGSYKLNTGIASLIFLAAIAWIAIEAATIFLALPRSVDFTLDRALEHVVVDNMTNLSPQPTPDKCRTITWRAHGMDSLREAIVIKRCQTDNILLPTTEVQEAPDTPTTTFSILTYNNSATQVSSVLPTARESGFQTEVVTHVFRPGSFIDAPLAANMDASALHPHIQDALAGSSCALVGSGPDRCISANATKLSWKFSCNQTEVMQSLVQTRLANVLLQHVDLRAARTQGARGFATSVTAMQFSNGADSVERRAAAAAGQAAADAFVAELTGSAVIARAQVPYVNLLTAAIVAAVAAVAYLALQINDRSAVEYALHCAENHR